MRRIRWLFSFALVVPVTFAIAVLPHAAAMRAGDMIGLAVRALWGSRRKIAEEAVRRAVDDGQIDIDTTAEELVRENFRNFGRSIVEVIKIYYGLGGRYLKNLTIEGMEHHQRLRAEGRGIIYITGHFGNWELLALASSYHSEPVSVLARPINNPYLNWFVERARARYGNHIIYKRGAIKTMISILRDGGTIGVLMDQAVMHHEGYKIDFLGHPAWTTKMPVILAKKTGAALVPSFIKRTPEGHHITVLPEVELTGDDVADTERLSKCVDEAIRKNPSEWLWIHKRWKRA